MINLLLDKKTPGKIDNIVLDATLRETMSCSNEITQYPSETGARSDNARPTPESVTIEGIFSDTPIGTGALDFASYGDSFRSSTVGQAIKRTGTRTEQALTELLRISGRTYPNEGTSAIPLVTIVTGLRTYSSMMMTSLNVTREPGSGKSLSFVATFTKVEKFSFVSVTIDASKIKETASLRKKASATTAAGKTTAEEPKARVSLAVAGMKRLLGRN